MRRTLAIISLLPIPLLSSGGHFSGASITYDCLGGNQYKVYLDLFLDCSGTEVTPPDLTFKSSCGTTMVFQDLTPASVQEISPLCPDELENSSCNGGPMPGFRWYRFQVQTTLSSCNSWNIYWFECCRNTMVNLQGTPGLYASATVNTAGGFCDDSPVFTTTGIPFVCLGQTMQYNAGVQDPDDHTFTYALIAARRDVPLGSTVPYASGYSAAQPIPGIALDPSTGQITFTPVVAGNYTVVLQITSYKSNGALIGRVMKDIMFIVPACNDPAPTFEGLSNNDNGLIMSNGEIAVCVGMDVCVDLVFDDDDPASTISLSTNATTLLPGATFEVSGTSPVTGTLCFTVTADAYPFSVLVAASDGACPIPNISYTPITSQDCVLLPVELTGISAEYSPSGITINWTTASESFSDRFEVQRSENGSTFIAIGSVPAAGSSAIPIDYSFTDDDPAQGTNYYRLRQIDLDGTYTYSPLVVAEGMGQTGKVMPDGLGGWYITLPAGRTEWSLFDMVGRQMATGSNTGSNTLHIGGDRAGEGMHVLVCTSNNGTKSLKLPITFAQ